MDDVSSNVIDLRARLAALRGKAVATGAAEATAELQSLRSTLHNLAIFLQLRELSGDPFHYTDKILHVLDELALELAQCMQGLGLTPD